MDLLYGGILGLSSFVLLFGANSGFGVFFKISFVIICAYDPPLGCAVCLTQLAVDWGIDGLWQIIIPVFFCF